MATSPPTAQAARWAAPADGRLRKRIAASSDRSTWSRRPERARGRAVPYFVSARRADEPVALVHVVHVKHDLTYRVGELVPEAVHSRGSPAQRPLTSRRNPATRNGCSGNLIGSGASPALVPRRASRAVMRTDLHRADCRRAGAFSMYPAPSAGGVRCAPGDLRNQLCHGDSALLWPGVGHVGTSARVATNTEAAARSDDRVASVPGARSAGPGLLGTPGLRECHRVPAGCSL
jgi:hypothetical protein